MRRAIRTGLIVGLMPIMLGVIPRADAANASTGTLQFAGTAVIPTFPCAAPAPGQFLCVGSFTASTAGTVNGVFGDDQWYAALSATTNGQFSYADSVQPGVPCVEGTAAGTASLDTQATGQAFGTYKDGSQLRTVRQVQISYAFTWSRTGATAVLSVTGVTITLVVDVLGSVTVVSGGTALAAATFLPHVDSEPPRGCVSGPATELRGSILGNVFGIAVQ